MSLSPGGGYSPQPFTAYLHFYVGGELITLNADNSPDYFQTFRFEKSVFGVGRFYLTITDPKWTIVHEKLVNSPSDVKFYYGYEGGIQSIVYSGFLTHVTPSFIIDGVQLSIEGYAQGPNALSGKAKTRSWPDNRKHGPKFLRISEIVEFIAKENSWLTSDKNGNTIEKTKELKVAHAFDSAEPVNKRFVQQRQTDFEFIRGLAFQSVSDKTEEGGYTAYIDFSGGGPTLHFHPLKFNNPPNHYYEYMRDPNSEVISFEMDASSADSLFKQGGVDCSVPYYDHITKRFKSVSKNNQNTPEKTKLNQKWLGTTPDSTEKESPYVLLNPAENKEVAEAQAKSHYMYMFNTGIKANMVIMGDPRLNISDILTVMVKGPSDRQRPHYVSGNYFVQSIVDDIAGGSFTTTLGLISNGLGEGKEAVIGKDNSAPASK